MRTTAYRFIGLLLLCPFLVFLPPRISGPHQIGRTPCAKVGESLLDRCNLNRRSVQKYVRTANLELSNCQSHGIYVGLRHNETQIFSGSSPRTTSIFTLSVLPWKWILDCSISHKVWSWQRPAPWQPGLLF